MKIQNIATCCSKTDIKPELSKVYVYTSNDIKYAVATDIYRLAELNLTATENPAVDFIKDGFYTVKEWQLVTSIVNKKKLDFQALESLLYGINAVQERYKGYNYPEYKKIIPQESECETLKISDIQLSRVFLIEMLELIPLDTLKMGEFKQKKDIPCSVIVYKDNTITLLLCPISY